MLDPITMIIVIAYMLCAFATFVRGHFQRQLAMARGSMEPTNADILVNKKLWEVRHKFESLFRDDRARKNALTLFPQLMNLPEEPEGKSPEVVSYKQIVVDSLFWPVAVPLSMSSKAAANIVASEAKDAEATVEMYEILAAETDDPELAEIFRLGDPKAVDRAMFEKAVRDNKAAKAREKMEESMREITDGSETTDDVYDHLNLRTKVPNIDFA